MENFLLKWIVEPQHHGQLLRDYLKEKQVSKRALTDIKFAGGKLTVDGDEVTVRHILQAGSNLTVEFPAEERSGGIQPENTPLEILYEDDHCLVIHKKAGMPSIPSREHPAGTVANNLLGYYDSKNIPGTIHIVTRLDKDTSGVMLIAKHRHAHSLFSLQQKQHQIRRTYEAVVHGRLLREQGTIDAPIGRSENSIIEREVREDGQQAITHFKVLQREEDKTKVSLSLETGRTHQIRVHMAYLGHPLCGDTLYGGDRQHIERQALHSRTLTFWHPILGKQLAIDAPLPADMKKLLL
ncbi:RluA family pseudouridine synthase [Bacillus lacus]|uniref:Pseudouridine synthase n=1 Tax=Metabacillus lacus TaxID=1983721 RepID=A0A7X2J1J3_9BACI|nr:RluA family pseudouridine synthase [Metabacillus lacus]MRX73631.1 RluA family pseudouridine synthase [Metabacillus lacus]